MPHLELRLAALSAHSPFHPQDNESPPITVAKRKAMTELYSRLSAVGLSRPFVKKTALPDWWEDEIGENPASYAEALLYLSRHLGLSLETLQDPTLPIALRNFGPCKFKHTAGTGEDELALAQAIGIRASQLAVSAMPNPLRELPESAADIRLAIIGTGEPWVSFRALLKYCWSIGIPVVFLARFPPHAKKMHGMAVMFRGRPAIVLSKNAKQPAWLLFVLAHELGHIICEHLSDGSALVDQDVENNESDDEEKEANDFALELITGKPKYSVIAPGRWPNAHELARSAKEIAEKRQIDPGHIVLNYAHSMGPDFWAVANAALKLLEPDANAPVTVRSMLAAKLDWSLLPKDSCSFLMRVTKAESE